MHKIVLNLNSLTTPHLTGIGTYVQRLGLEFKRSRSLADGEFNFFGSLKLSRLSHKKRVLHHLQIPILIDEIARNIPGAFRLYHGPDFRIPKASFLNSRLKRVVTVHDLVTFEKELTDPAFAESGNAELQEMLVKRAPDAILVNSNFTRSELLRYFPELEPRVHLTPLGCDHLSSEHLSGGPAGGDHGGSALGGSALGGSDHHAVGHLSGGPRFFLFVGTLEVRKNLFRILDAFEEFSKMNPGFRLVLIGSQGYQGAEISKRIAARPDLFINPGFCERTVLNQFYRKAEALFFPSLYEGFGIPILEAMQLGCPVITSNCGAMKEVSGDAAFLVDPKNMSELVHSLQLMTETSEAHGWSAGTHGQSKESTGQLSRPGNQSHSPSNQLRRRCIELGYQRWKKFTWKNCAEKTLDCYRSVLNKSVL